MPQRQAAVVFTGGAAHGLGPRHRWWQGLQQRFAIIDGFGVVAGARRIVPLRPAVAAVALPITAVAIGIIVGAFVAGTFFTRAILTGAILTGPIFDQVASLVCAQLLFLESENPNKDIAFYINSPGGVVTAGLAMYDTMQYIRSPVSTVCIGMAASAGSLLLTAGAKGKRFALPNSQVMIHQPSGGAQGQASDIAIQAREILKTRERLNNIYVHHTGQPLAEIEAKMERDTYMTAIEARDFGLVDEVVEQRPLPPEAKG